MQPIVLHAGHEEVSRHDHPLKLCDLPSDYIKAGSPKIWLRNVETKPLAKRYGVGHACRGEQLVVSRLEGCGLFAIPRVEAEAE